MPRVTKPVPATAPSPEIVPRRVDRAKGAALLSLYFFPATARSIETWPEIDWIILNGKACCETEALFAAAQARIDAARPARPPFKRQAKIALVANKVRAS